MRMRAGVGYLRGYRLRKAIEASLREAKERFGLRVIHDSIQGNHLHPCTFSSRRTAPSR